MQTSAFSLPSSLNRPGRQIMWSTLFFWILLSYLDGEKSSVSNSISLCIDMCTSTPKFDASKEMSTFVCHFNGKRKRKNGIYVDHKKHGSQSLVIGIYCLITTQHVEPWCLCAQCKEVSSTGKRLPGRRTPGQLNTVVSNTTYSCTRRNLPSLSWCTKRKGTDTKEKTKSRMTEERKENTITKNKDSRSKEIPKKNTSTRGYKAIQAGRDRILVKQYHMNKTWDQAYQQCEADGGHLIKLDTKHKLRAMRLFNIYASHWIGMKDLYDNDTFLWFDGAPASFKGWCTSQPSHWSHEGQQENCVETCDSEVRISAKLKHDTTLTLWRSTKTHMSSFLVNVFSDVSRSHTTNKMSVRSVPAMSRDDSIDPSPPLSRGIHSKDRCCHSRFNAASKPARSCGRCSSFCIQPTILPRYVLKDSHMDS